MVRKFRTKVGPIAILLTLVLLSLYTAPGCEVEISYNGHMENGVCVYGGNDCEVKIKAKS